MEYSVVLDTCVLYPTYLRVANHPKDRHVLAAAVRSNAAAIVTFNDADFPEPATEPYSVDVVHPDKFLLDQLGLAPGVVMATMQDQTQGYGDPPLDVAGLASALERCGTPQFASEVRRHMPPAD